VYTAVFLQFGVAISDLNVVIFAGQPAGLTDRLPVGSGQENLDRFHLCGTSVCFKDDTSSHWEEKFAAIWDSEILEPIEFKFGMNDRVRHTTPHARIDTRISIIRHQSAACVIVIATSFASCFTI